MAQQSPNPGDQVAVKLPTSLVNRVAKRLDKSEFKSVEEYISFVVDQVLTEVEGKEGGAKDSENVFSKEDQASVEQRLRDLGYM